MGTNSTDLSASRRAVAVVGGGPAGLRAAEVLSSAGHQVTLYEGKATVGRKFLVAGSGGLNLTHSESLDLFSSRYGEGERWRDLLSVFSPADLRAWALDLGIETFVGTSGRVFPTEKKAAPLLRQWVGRLRRQGVLFRVRHRWKGFSRGGDGGLRLYFEHERARVEVGCDAVVLALGGASWPETGSDGGWVDFLRSEGVEISRFRAANCGYHVAWSPEVLARVEGLPLKNVAVEAGGVRVEGDCVVTRYGLEGGPIYRLGPVLRGLPEGERGVRLDFKPGLTADALERKWGALPKDHRTFLSSVVERWRLGPAVTALLEMAGPYPTAASLIERVKGYPISLGEARPIGEAISSAGGIGWGELDGGLMVRRVPGLFVAGEMIDWDAPTGGYLLQGCFTTGTVAARGVGRYLAAC